MRERRKGEEKKEKEEKKKDKRKSRRRNRKERVRRRMRRWELEESQVRRFRRRHIFLSLNSLHPHLHTWKIPKMRKEMVKERGEGEPVGNEEEVVEDGHGDEGGK